MIKKLVGLTLGGLLASACFIMPSYAVDGFSIKDVDAGDSSVRIDFEKAHTSDRYTIKLNNKVLESDRIDTAGNGILRLPTRISNRETFRNGDTIEISITSNSSSRDIVRTYTIRGNSSSSNRTNNYYGGGSGTTGGVNGYNVPINAPNNVARPNVNTNPNAPVDPTLASTLTADKATLWTESGKQAVTLTFNKGFVAKKGDFILAIALDKDNKRLKTEEFSLPTASNASIKVDVEPPVGTVNYQFIFVAGEVTNKGNARAIVPVKDGSDQVMELDTKTAYVNAINEMSFTLKDKSGKVTPLSFVPTEVSLVSTNHEGHTILLSDVSIDTTTLASSAKGTLRFKTTELGTLNLRLSAKDEKGNSYLSHFAPLVVKEDNRVLMTIGSNKLKVGPKEVVVDAAPEVIGSRTFVPLRALVESFAGTDLKYSASDKKITVKQDNTTVILTLGDKAYTVNGATKMMDTKPYVTKTRRTMVPVRAIAEALGYKVTFKKENGKQSVLFEKEESTQAAPAPALG